MFNRFKNWFRKLEEIIMQESFSYDELQQAAEDNSGITLEEFLKGEKVEPIFEHSEGEVTTDDPDCVHVWKRGRVSNGAIKTCAKCLTHQSITEEEFVNLI